MIEQIKAKAKFWECKMLWAFQDKLSSSAAVNYSWSKFSPINAKRTKEAEMTNEKSVRLID